MRIGAPTIKRAFLYICRIKKMGWTSIVIVVGVLVLGATLAPSDRIFSDSYASDASHVLHAAGTRTVDKPLTTLLPWLLPIPVAAAVPLSWTLWPTRVLAILTTGFMLLPLLLPTEASRIWDFVRREPAFGYLWHEAVLFLTATAVTFPHTWQLLASPMVAVTFASRDPTVRRPIALAVVLLCLAVASFAVVLPTVAPFVSDDGDDFFLTGVSTQSIAFTALTIGYVICWVRVYHLVCHDARDMRASGGGIVLSALWAMVGTALVLVWVSAAWACHLAVRVLLVRRRSKNVIENA